MTYNLYYDKKYFVVQFASMGLPLQAVNPNTDHGVHSCCAPSAACINVFVPNDIILAEIAAGLNFDQYHWHFAWVLHPVCGTERDIARLVFRDERHFIINGDLGRAFDDDSAF